jgi:hypothetical protein
MPTINRVVWGEVGDGLAAAKSDLVGEREVMEVTEIQVILVLILYTIPPTTGKREIVVVVIGPYSMTPLHTRPEKTDPSCEQGRSGRPYDAHPLGHRVTARSISLFAPAAPARSPAPSLEGLGLSHPTPPPHFPTQDLARYSREGRRWGVEGICFSLWVSHAAGYQLINYLSGISSPARSIHPPICARKRRQRGKLKFTNPLPATAIPITGSCLACPPHLPQW